MASRSVGKNVTKIQCVASWLMKGRESSFELLRDPTRDEFIKLASENECRMEEFKRIRSYLDHMRHEYDAARHLDVVRRYSRLKSMIQRTVMHLRVHDMATGLGAIGSLLQNTRDMVKRAEQSRKIEEKEKSMTSEELMQENRRLEEGNKDLRCKITVMTELIRDLDQQYDRSKRLSCVRRYTVLKTLVKNVLHHPIVKENG